MRRIFTTRNVGTLDRVIRTLPAAATLWAWSAGQLSGGWLVATAILSVMLLVTSLTGACSIYYALGWSTCPVSGRPRD